MRMDRRIALFLVLLAATAPLSAAPLPLDPLVERVRNELLPVIKKAYPDFDQAGKGPVWNVWARTQVYFTQPIFVDNQIVPQPQKETGPRPDGFMLSFTRNKGPYQGEQAMPSLVPKPHWTVFSDEMNLLEGKERLSIVFSYGKNTPPEFIDSIHHELARLARILNQP